MTQKALKNFRISSFSKAISYFVEGFVVDALVADIIVAGQQRVNEEFDAAQMVASSQLSSSGDHVLGDGVERYINRIAPRLVSASVYVEIKMTDWFEHAVTEQKDCSGVSVDGVDKLGIGGIQTDVLRHVLEVRFSWIETGNSAKSRNSLASVTASVRSK